MKIKCFKEYGKKLFVAVNTSNHFGLGNISSVFVRMTSILALYSLGKSLKNINWFYLVNITTYF